MKLLDEDAGLVHAPVEQVCDAVLDVVGTQWRVAGTELRLEAGEGRIEGRGQWWWCGRYEVRSDANGARVVAQTYNLAGGLSGRLVPFTVGRGHREHNRAGLRGVLDEVGRRLACDTELL